GGREGRKGGRPVLRLCVPQTGTGGAIPVPHLDANEGRGSAPPARARFPTRLGAAPPNLRSAPPPSASLSAQRGRKEGYPHVVNGNGGRGGSRGRWGARQRECHLRTTPLYSPSWHTLFAHLLVRKRGMPIGEGGRASWQGETAGRMCPSFCARGKGDEMGTRGSPMGGGAQATRGWRTPFAYSLPIPHPVRSRVAPAQGWEGVLLPETGPARTRVRALFARDERGRRGRTQKGAKGLCRMWKGRGI
ncbi:hypothetical protein EDB84DRAFT_1447080, partial [Lactarius hengduanensis]